MENTTTALSEIKIRPITSADLKVHTPNPYDDIELPFFQLNVCADRSIRIFAPEPTADPNAIKYYADEIASQYNAYVAENKDISNLVSVYNFHVCCYGDAECERELGKISESYLDGMWHMIMCLIDIQLDIDNIPPYDDSDFYD